MCDDGAHPILADVAVADVGVFVLVGPTLVFGVVEVETLQVLQSNDVVELRDHVVDGLGRREVVPRREHVGRVETDRQVLVRAVQHFGEVFELAAEFRPGPGVGLDQDGHVRGDVEFVQRAGGVVQAAVDARAGVGPEVDVDVLDPESVGGVDLLLHRVDGLLAEVLFGRTEVDQIRGVDHPGTDVVGRRALAELVGFVVADVRVLPDLRRVGEYLPAVAAVLDLFVDRVVRPAGD